MDKNQIKVCVTGGAGYLGSFLVKELLDRGYIVHATLRDLGDESKVGFLKGLARADTGKLRLFEADIYKPNEFGAAIQGCDFVFHMATPLQHYSNNTEYKSTSEAAVAGAKSIMESCIRSKTVRKLIYTATVLAASPWREDGSGYKDVMDENCWTPPGFTCEYSKDYLQDYVTSKTLAEQEVLSYNGKGIQVVSLACGLVGGGTVQSTMSETLVMTISQGLNDMTRYKVLRFLEEILGKVPIVHIKDAIEAHIFSMENSNINGRFLCASDFLKTTEIASIIKRCEPEICIPQGLIEETNNDVKWGSTKLEALGFEYQYGDEKTIIDSLTCAKNFGKLTIFNGSIPCTNAS